MEAGVGRGQRGGQRCTSCMLGNAALFFFLPHLHSFSAYFFFMQVEMHTPCACSMHSTHTYTHRHAHTQAFSHPLLSPILIHSSKLFSIFLISFSLNLSLTHSFTHLFTHAYLHLFHFRSLSLLTAPHPHPTLPSLHPCSCLTLICKWREDLTEEYVEGMWFPSQVGNSGGR